MEALSVYHVIINQLKAGELPERAHIMLVVADEITRQALLRQPALAQWLAQQATAASTVDCQMVEEMLPLFLAGVPASHIPHASAIELHLQLCPACMELYAVAQQLDIAQRQGDLPLWPGIDSGPRLQPHIDWLPIVVPQGHLSRAVAKIQGGTFLRSTAQRERHRLYSGPHSNQPALFTYITLVRNTDIQPPSWSIEVALKSNTLRYAGCPILIQYAEHQQHAATDSTGIALFDTLPIPTWLEQSPTDLRIVLGMAS